MYKDGRIPFDEAGSMVDYQHGYNISEWRENSVFEGVYRFKGSTRGRSSVKFVFEDEEGKTIAMFLSDFEDMLRMPGVWQDGSLAGWWTFCKKGSNYGAVYLGEKGFSQT